MPTAAIFSDVGAEPKSVYDYLNWLEGGVTFPRVPSDGERWVVS